MKYILTALLFLFSSSAGAATFILNKMTVVIKTPQNVVTTPQQNEFHPMMRGYMQLKVPVTADGILDNVDVYDIDLEDNEKSGIISQLKDKGIKVVCYFSAGSYEDWRSDNEKFPPEILGNDLADWDGERWLDIRSETTKSIMAARMDRAANAGCDAVDPDNVDVYQDNKSGFPLTEADGINYLRWLADYAHGKGLKISLKNTIGIIQSASLQQYFDFAINESCYRYQECDLLKPFVAADKWVFILEYDASQAALYCQSAKNNKYFLSFFNKELDGATYIPCP